MKATIMIHCVVQCVLLAVMNIQLISAAGSTSIQLNSLAGQVNQAAEPARFANHESSSDSEKSAEPQSFVDKEPLPGPVDRLDQINEVREQEKNQTEMPLNNSPRVRRYVPYGNGRGIEKKTLSKPKYRSNNSGRSETRRRISTKKSKTGKKSFSNRVSPKARTRSQSNKVTIQFVPEGQ